MKTNTDYKNATDCATIQTSGNAVVDDFGGAVADTDYGAAVTLRVLLPEERAEAFRTRIFELSAGKIEANVAGETFRAVKK